MVRIGLVQPDIRPYRAAIYRLLGSQPEIDLHVYCDRAADAPNPTEGALPYTIHPVAIRQGRAMGLSYFDHPGFAQTLEAGRYDLLIYPWATRYRGLTAACRRARRMGTPTVVWGHGYSKQDSRLRVWLRNRVGRQADAIMLYTHGVAQRMIDRWGFDPQRVFVAQNAVDQTPIQAAREDWAARPDDLQAFAADHGLDRTRCVAFVSRLLAENRPDRLIQAVALLQARLPGCTAVLIGDGPERPRLEQQARELGVADHVRFTGALYGETDLAPWLLNCGVFCYPENVGLSLLTAFGFGLPAVTCDDLASQNPEIEALRPGENGLLYPTGSNQAMADAVLAVLADGERQAQMSAEALRTVLQDYNAANMVQGFLDTTRLVDGVQRQVVV